MLRVDVYNIDTTGPTAASIPTVSTSGISSAGATAGKAEMQWQPTTDPGAGVMLYQLWRRPLADPNAWQYKGSTHVPSFVDRDAPAGASYMYLLLVYNYHFSFTDTQFADNIP